MDAVILAAGTGSRMNAGYNKMFIKINGKEVLWHTLSKFCQCSCIDRIILVTGKCDVDYCEKLAMDFDKDIVIVEGGQTRQESSYAGVTNSDSDFVLVHDGARALITCEDIEKTAEAVAEYKAVAVGSFCYDTLKRCDSDGYLTETVDRENTIKIYTPQGFDRKMLIEFHERAVSDKFVVTDESSLCEFYGQKVKFIPGNPFNIKLTTPEDIVIAEKLLKNNK